MHFPGLSFYVVAAAVLLLLLFLLPFTLRIKLHNLRDDSSVLVTLKVALFGRIPLFALQKTLGRGGDIYPGWLVTFFRRPGPYGPVGLLRVGAALNWQELTVLLRTGTGDPASTGVAVGLLRALGGLLAIKLRHRAHFAPGAPLIRIYPSFWKQEFTYALTAEGSGTLGLFVYNILFPRLN